jgi:Fibronectin type III-like domain
MTPIGEALVKGAWRQMHNRKIVRLRFFAIVILAASAAAPVALSQSADRPWMNTNLSPEERAELVLKQIFEFGYGLSYTHFTYADLSVKRDTDHTLYVSFSVKNDGGVAGAEIPQVYLGMDFAGEPPLRLGGGSKVRLNLSEVQQVSITASPRMQSIWDTSANDWRLIPDTIVYVGALIARHTPEGAVTCARAEHRMDLICFS